MRQGVAIDIYWQLNEHLVDSLMVFWNKANAELIRALSGSTLFAF